MDKDLKVINPKIIMVYIYLHTRSYNYGVQSYYNKGIIILWCHFILISMCMYIGINYNYVMERSIEYL